MISTSTFGESIDKLLRDGVQCEPRILALTGKARSGKDTVADMLRKAYGAKTAAFADPIRAALRAMIPGLTDEHFNGKLKEETIDWLGKSPRQLMQTLGTEWGRQLVNTDIWLLIAGRKIEGFIAGGNHAVITDCRFENEADYIRSIGGQVWHVYRPGVQAVAAHASEAGVLFDNRQGDKLIYNNGTLDELFDLVCETFEGE